MTTYVTANQDVRVYAGNIRTNGNRARKDQTIILGERLPILREFESSGMATHGDKCAWIWRNGYELAIRLSHFTKEESHDH